MSLRRHLTYANIASTLAVIVAVGGGTAYAANTIFSTDIVDGQVMTVDLAGDAVTTDKIKDGEIQAADLHSGSVGSPAFKPGAVNSLAIRNGAVGSPAVANGSLRLADLAGVRFDGQLFFPSDYVAAGKCRQDVVNLVGTKVGDIPILVFGGDVPAGLSITALRVPFDDQMTINTCNFSGGVFPAISGLPTTYLTLR